MKITNTDRYYLKGTNNRFLHLATVIDRLHEYIAFIDLQTNKCYIEELTVNGLLFIEDDDIAEDVNHLLIEHQVTDLTLGLPTPDNE